METIVAIAASILVVIQAHRNYLMVQARKDQKPINVSVQSPEIPPISIQTVPPVNEINFEIDYDKLAQAIARSVTVVSAPAPTVIPNYPQGPTWQFPIVSGEATNEIVADDGHSNDVEINGYKAKKFPTR